MEPIITKNESSQITESKQGKNWFSRLRPWQKIILIVLIIPFVLLFIGVVFPAPHSEHKNPNNHSMMTASQNSTTSCGSQKQLFKMSPIAPSEISTIIPLGNLAPPGHVLPTTHMYYRYLHTNNVPKLTTLYVPADMTATKIMLSDNNSLPTPYNSYRIDFSVCDEVQGYFILVFNINDKLKAAFHEPYDKVETSNVGGIKQEHNSIKNVSVKLNAGEVLGTGGGGLTMPNALDVGLSDTRIPSPTVANSARWIPQDLHYVCSLDYFPDTIKQTLYTKFGDFSGHALDITSPQCGEVYQDIPGTAQGIWVSKTSAAQGLWDVPNNLALVHSNFNHKEAVFSMGNILQQLGFNNSNIYTFSPQSDGLTNIDFNKVTPNGKIYCYETSNSSHNPGITAIIQLLDANTLRIGKLSNSTCGSGPWQFSSYLDFIR